MLNPLLIWFLPLALVPIVLHLITLYRLRTVELSTFRFLMDSYIQQRRRVKLLEFLLMLLRTAFVALVILALSRPVLERLPWLTGRTGREVIVILDAGATTGLRTMGTTTLEREQAAAATVVKMLTPDDHVMVIAAADKPRVLVSRFGGQNQTIVDQIQQLRPSAAGADLAAALREGLSADPHGDRIVYILTDGSHRSWSTLTGSPVLQKLVASSQVVVMNLAPTEPVNNLSLVGEPPRGVSAVVGLPVVLQVTVVNNSTEKPADVPLAVYLDDQQVAQLNLSLEPGQKATRTVTVTPTHAGNIRGRFQLPADDLTEDDQFLFCLNVQPRINVLILAPAAGKSTDPPELYLQAALKSPLAALDRSGALPGAAAATTPLTELQRAAASLDIRVMQPAAATDAILNTCDVVILANVSMDAALGTRLRKWAQDGGGLVVFPGADVQPDAYTKHLFSSAADPTAPAPVELLPARGNIDDESQFQPLTSVDVTNPILSVFAERKSEAFATSRLYQYYPLKIADPSTPTVAPSAKPANKKAPNPTANLEAAMPTVRPRARVLMRIADRTAVLAEFSMGEGRCLLAGFPATPDWSNVPLKPQFVPMLLRAVAHVRRPPAADAIANVAANEPAPLRITDRWSDARAEVVDPTDKASPVPLHRSGKAMIGAALETELKGYYTFRISPRTPGAPERLELAFAVNLSIDQADFTRLSKAQITSILEPAKLTYLEGSSEDPVLAGQLTQRREIWRLLIWFTFAVIGLEFFLSTLLPAPVRSGAGSQAPSGIVGRMTQWMTRLAAGRTSDKTT